MAKKLKPTENQKQVFNKMMERVANGEKVVIGELMREVGLSPATAHNPGKNLISRPGWQILMAQLDDAEFLDKLKEIGLDTADKRACLEAIKIIFQLKGRFETKVRINAYEERDKILKEVLE